MADIYQKVGTTLTLRFVYINSSGQPVTGAGGSFTVDLESSGTGNQPTTGITGPTEVDSVNNPGLYELTCSGTTSFVATTGQYGLRVRVTASPQYEWTQTVRVTSDGTGAGTWGSAAFTATANNGRVTNGSSPVQGATIYLQAPSGSIYLQTTTDVNGLWGTVYLPNNGGTYTIIVQDSGYTQATGTIVVSGSTATGPGADLVITQNSATSSLIASTYMAYTQRIMVDASGTKSQTLVTEILNEALELIAMEKQWEWFHTRGAVNVQGPFTSGTLTITNGSTAITLSGATWPSWATTGTPMEIYVNNKWAEISSINSSTTATLVNPWGDPSATGATFQLVQVRYQLPTNVARMSKTLLGPAWPFNGQYVSAAQWEAIKDAWQYTQQNLTIWSIEKGYLCVWPIPQTTVQINLLYFRKPAQIVNPTDVIDWDPNQILLLRKAIDYCASLRGTVVSGPSEQCYENYSRALAAAWAQDKSAADPDAGTGLPIANSYLYLPGAIT